MDTNYIINNDNLFGVDILDIKDKIIIDEYTFNYIINYLFEKVFFNYLLILFILSCGTTFYVCSYKNNRDGYVLIKNKEPLTIKGEIIEKV